MTALKNAQPKSLSRKERAANEAEQKRLRLLVKEVIWPIFLKSAKSVQDAKLICKTLTVGMDALFMQEIKKYQESLSAQPLSNLKLTEVMNDVKDYPTEWALVDALKNETISCSKDLIEGLEKELDRLTDKELAERGVDSLKTEWL